MINTHAYHFNCLYAAIAMQRSAYVVMFERSFQKSAGLEKEPLVRSWDAGMFVHLACW